MEVGDVVIFRNLVFEDKYVDHSLGKGRRCIYIGELEGKMYFISACDATNWNRSKKLDYLIKPNNRNSFIKLSLPNIKNLIEKKSSFYDVIGYLSDDEVTPIFKAIKKYYTEVRSRENEIFLTLADNYLKTNKVNYKDSKASRKIKS